EFQDALASSNPTPGGGSAAGVALGQAAALSVMVSDLTLAKESLKDGWEISERVKTVAIPMLEQGLNLATEDSEAFDAVVDSFKLPRDTEELKLKRRESIRSATLGAAEVPYRTAAFALQLLKLLPELAEKGNPNAASDVGVASLLASAALKGAIFNVEINLQSLPEDYGIEMREALPSLIEDGRIYSRKAMDAVRIRLTNQ
ncbi:MAG: cyclodeaminase/cyclohydrolase family protein, partial [Candidatus Poseidoniaceae archaeon]